MKKLIALISIALAIAGSASANTYSDTNSADVRLDANANVFCACSKVGSANPLYNPSYTGNFTLGGYDSSLEEIISAQISFRLWDAAFIGGGESYLVTLVVGDLVKSGNSFSGPLDFDYNLPFGGTALMSLSDTGALAYTVTATTGSFWLDEASITAESALRTVTPPSVPETSTTFVLLGATLLGLAAVRRKIRA